MLRAAQTSLVLGKIRIVPVEQVEAESRRYQFAGEHGGLVFARYRLADDRYDFELVSIAAPAD